MRLTTYYILLSIFISTYSISAVTYNIKNNTTQPLKVSVHTLNMSAFGASCTTHHRNETAQGDWIPIPAGEMASPSITPGSGCIADYMYYNSPSSAQYHFQKPGSSSTITINYGSVPGESEERWSITETTTDGQYTNTAVCDPASNDCGLPTPLTPGSSSSSAG